MTGGVELARDELSLNRLLVPLVSAEAGIQFFGRVPKDMLELASHILETKRGRFGSGIQTR